MDSIDIEHVPPPDPANFWQFQIGTEIVVSPGPTLVSLKLLAKEAARGHVMMRVEESRIKGWLNLDRPCVALRDAAGRPMLTLTLRKVTAAAAFLQVSAPVSLPQRPRE